MTDLADEDLRKLMVRISLASRGSAPIWWLEGLPIREFMAWSGTIADELNSMAED